MLPPGDELAPMTHITSRQNPVVLRYRAVADGDDRTLMLLDGVHLVTDALDAGVAIVDAVVSHDEISNATTASLLDRLHESGAELRSANGQVMAALSPLRSPSPLVARARRGGTTPRALFEIATPVVVAAVDVQDPGNLGAIVRVAEAGGATGVAVVGRSADPFGWKALRGSMGSALRLPIAMFPEPQTLLTEARRRGCRVVASLPRGGRSPEDADLSGPIVLLVGGEGAGLPAPLCDAADLRVSIPMAPAVESLNTAVGAALLVYESRRQRLAQATHGIALSRPS
jgi:RNA methyltransferase, TrmH family